MTPRRLITAVIATVGVVAATLLGLALWSALALTTGKMTAPQVVLVFSMAVFAFGFLLVVAWWLLESRLSRPLDAITREVRRFAGSSAESRFLPPERQGLDALIAALEELAEAFIRARRETLRAMQSASARVEEQLMRMEAILHDLTEGVLVCNRNHEILLYNAAAAKILDAPETLGLGRSLFTLITEAPILHAIERLAFRLEQSARRDTGDRTTTVVCATTQAPTLMRGRVTVILGPGDAIIGYVLTVSDIGGEIADLAKRDALIHEATEGLRAPVANLRAAAETVADHPAMTAAERAAFQQVMLRESTRLSQRLQALLREARGLTTVAWPMAEVHSTSLFSCVLRRLSDAPDIALTLVGLPLWLRADGYALMLALDFLIRRIHAQSGAAAVDITATADGSRAAIDLIWTGEPIRSSSLDRWLETTLPGTVGGRTLAQILRAHGGEPWSQRGRGGQALLRIPVHPTPHDGRDASAAAVPARPEFYDFDLFDRPAKGKALGDRLLRDLSFVVFDTETTGLKPSAGDEIISIAGVRVVNGRVLTGDDFQRLVNPGRSIPARSVRFHGITEDMIVDKPPIQVVLPQFLSFTRDAVLVAHNAAFDMKFIRLKEPECAITFDNPVLDTLLLSVFLHPEQRDHTLDGITHRFGIEIVDRHTALGDAMVTAAVFVHFLELLEARGIETLGEALTATESVVHVRRMQEQF